MNRRGREPLSPLPDRENIRRKRLRRDDSNSKSPLPSARAQASSKNLQKEFEKTQNMATPTPTSGSSCSSSSRDNSQTEPEEQETEKRSQSSRPRSQPKARVEEESVPVPNKSLEYYHSRINGTFVQPSSGSIKKVRMFNFMCHESFEKEWNSNMNFIIGENGSGKSAILSGIIVGLGGRAATTSRTKSIKGLVKHGKDSAKIEVTLNNNNESRIDKYGNELVIQRVIDLNGVSTYKIDDGTTGRFRALRRTELEFILATFGIMIDNPVAILNQETARSFLKTKDPKDKYNFFFEGSSLGNFSRILGETSQNMEDSKFNLAKAKELVAECEVELKANQKQKKRLEDAEKLEDFISNLNKEYNWSLVLKEEEKYDRLVEEMEQETKNVEIHTSAIDELKQKKEGLMSKAGTRPEDMEAVKEELRHTGKLEMDIAREITNIKRKGGEIQGRIRSTESNIKHLRSNIKQLENKTEELSRNGEAEAEQAKKEQEEQMADFQEQKERFQQEYKALMTDKEQFQRGTESLRSQLNDLNTTGRELTQQLEVRKKQLHNINKNTQEGKFDSYGPQMKALMSKIEANKNKFKVQPRGPIGIGFTVKDPKWIRLIELVLNNEIQNFIVENDKDQVLLNSLIKDTFHNRQSNVNQRPSRSPGVILHKAAFVQPIDVSRTTAKTPEHPTILDMLTFANNDHVVRNVLIDKSSIERILLFESNKDACDILKDRNHPKFPRKCVVGFTLDFYQVTPDPKYRLEAKNEKHQNVYLKCNPEAQLRNLQRSIQELESQLEEIKPEIAAKRQEEADFRRDLSQKENAVRVAQRNLSEIKAKILSLTGTPIVAPDVSSFVEELTETKEELVKAETQHEKYKEELDQLRPELKKSIKKKEEIEAKLAELRDKLEEMRDIVENYERKLSKLHDDIVHIKPKLRDAEGKCDRAKKQMEDLKKDIQKSIDRAERHSPRIATARPTEAIMQDINNYELRMEESKRILENRDEIIRNLQQAELRHRNITIEYRCWFEIYRLLSGYVDLNLNHFRMLVGIIGNVLTSAFHILISSRNYHGRLIIDHEAKELYYFVCPDGKANEKTKAALNSNNNKIIKNCLSEYSSGLSGGERSFATICYIISMWQIMECPFFMLDEFDVFMDPFNRKASQNALLSHAQRFRGYQYFLFTPLELADMKELESATILRMYPPKRDDVEPEAQTQMTDDIRDSDGADEEGSPEKRRKVEKPRKARPASRK